MQKHIDIVFSLVLLAISYLMDATFYEGPNLLMYNIRLLIQMCHHVSVTMILPNLVYTLHKHTSLSIVLGWIKPILTLW
jgi:hypothetical protein